MRGHSDQNQGFVQLRNSSGSDLRFVYLKNFKKHSFAQQNVRQQIKHHTKQLFEGSHKNLQNHIHQNFKSENHDRIDIKAYEQLAGQDKIPFIVRIGQKIHRRVLRKHKQKITKQKRTQEDCRAHFGQAQTFMSKRTDRHSETRNLSISFSLISNGRSRARAFDEAKQDQRTTCQTLQNLLQEAIEKRVSRISSGTEKRENNSSTKRASAEKIETS